MEERNAIDDGYGTDSRCYSLEYTQWSYIVIMPPLRGSSGVRGRSRDIVSQVEDKLKLNNALPDELLEATRSSLRVLKIRNPIGCFGKYDNDTKRACALLEYDIREYNATNSNSSNNTIEVAMERLAKAAFMKLKDFRDFHEKIGNFRENLRINATRAPKTKKKALTEEVQAKRYTGSTSKKGIVFQKSSISSLAVQLGAFVPNSSDVASRTQKLFREVVDLLENSSKKGGIYGLQDIQKNQSSYEAACFYLIATSGQRKRDNNASTRGRRKVSKELDDRDGVQELDLITFMDMTKASSQFETILDYVTKLQNEINSKQQIPNRNTSVQSRRLPKPKTSRKRSKEEAFDIAQTIGTDSSRRYNQESQGDRTLEQAEEIDTNNFFGVDPNIKENSYDQKIRKRRFRSNATFQEWKANALKAAFEDAKQKLNLGIEGNGGDFEKKQKREQILDFVVRGILERNGLY